MFESLKLSLTVTFTALCLVYLERLPEGSMFDDGEAGSDPSPSMNHELTPGLHGTKTVDSASSINTTFFKDFTSTNSSPQLFPAALLGVGSTSSELAGCPWQPKSLAQCCTPGSEHQMWSAYFFTLHQLGAGNSLGDAMWCKMHSGHCKIHSGLYGCVWNDPCFKHVDPETFKGDSAQRSKQMSECRKDEKCNYFSPHECYSWDYDRQFDFRRSKEKGFPTYEECNRHSGECNDGATLNVIYGTECHQKITACHSEGNHACTHGEKNLPNSRKHIYCSPPSS